MEVFIPPQECCGMPLIVEGDKKTALKKIHANIESLLGSVQNGKILKDDGYFSSLDPLKRIELSYNIIQFNKTMQCCGMGGHLGYKTSFHPHSLKIGQPLFERLVSEKDRTIITDCLS
ncbi:MAG: heterodisulfide reductase-related iron-sulfur binding cluster, partial [Pseudomonadota bacterium]